MLIFLKTTKEHNSHSETNVASYIEISTLKSVLVATLLMEKKPSWYQIWNFVASALMFQNGKIIDVSIFDASMLKSIFNYDDWKLQLYKETTCLLHGFLPLSQCILSSIDAFFVSHTIMPRTVFSPKLSTDPK